MQEVPEVGCESCGSSLIRPTTTPLDPMKDPLPLNICGACGHNGPFKFSFYWPADLQAYVQAKWPKIDMNAFRLSPRSFVEKELNPRLRTQRAGKVLLEGPENSLHLLWVKETSGSNREHG